MTKGDTNLEDEEKGENMRVRNTKAFSVTNIEYQETGELRFLTYTASFPYLTTILLFILLIFPQHLDH